MSAGVGKVQGGLAVRAAVTLQAFRMAELPTAFVLSVLLARRLGPSEFGNYVTATAAIGLLTCALALGGEELLQRAGHTSADVLVTVRRVRATVAGGAMAFALGQMIQAHGEPSLAGLTALALAFVLPVNLYAAAAIRALTPFVAACVSLIGLIGQIGFVVLWSVHSARAGIAIFALAQAIELTVLAVRARTRRAKTSRGSFERSIAPSMIIVMLLNFVTLVLGKQSDIVVGRWVGASRADIANYGIAFTVAVMANSVFVLGIGALTLRAMSLSLENGLAELGRRWREFLSVTSFLSIPVLVLVGGLAHPLVRLGFGSEYGNAALYLQIFALSFILIRLAGGGTNLGALLAMGMERTVLRVIGVSAVANVLLDVILIPIAGMRGALVASTLANVGTGAVLGAMVTRATGVAPPVIYYLRLVFAAVTPFPILLITAGGGYGEAALGGVAYLLAFVALGWLAGACPDAVVSRVGLLRGRLKQPFSGNGAWGGASQ